jgi:hypothetical protein
MAAYETGPEKAEMILMRNKGESVISGRRGGGQAQTALKPSYPMDPKNVTKHMINNVVRLLI